MIKKSCLLLATLLAAMVWSLPALAEVKTFGPFSVEVPAGWETNYEDGCLGMVHTGPKSMMMVCSIPLEGQPFGEAVLELAAVFEAVPKKDADGDYSFEFKNDEIGLTVHAVVTEEDGSIKLVGLAGEHPDLERILNSLEEK